jgi:lipoyl synthase
MLHQIQKTRKHPDWLRVKIPAGHSYNNIKQLVNNAGTNTVCVEAKCPNLGECWNRGTATFMILGDTCTRACKYCHVKTGWPNKKVDLEEPKKIAEIVKKLNLKYIVITSVDRDDLEDKGSSIFAETVKQIHSLTNAKVEVLTPDFQNNNLKRMINANPDVFGHNIEAVRRIFKDVRSKGNYNTSLNILKQAKEINPNQKTKSGLMIGFGESKEEIIETLKDLRKHDVDFLTIGQYLQPTSKHIKLEKYYTPQEFQELESIGKHLGFKWIKAGPLVRSSYRAEEALNMSIS